MKKLLFLFLLAATTVAQAQTSPADSLQALYQQNKTTAIVLAVTGPVTMVGGSAIIAVGALSDNTAAKALLITSGSIAAVAGIVQTVYAFVYAERADQQKAAMLKLRSGAAMHISYPMPVMVAGYAPGVGFAMKF